MRREKGGGKEGKGRGRGTGKDGAVVTAAGVCWRDRFFGFEEKKKRGRGGKKKKEGREGGGRWRDGL